MRGGSAVAKLASNKCETNLYFEFIMPAYCLVVRIVGKALIAHWRRELLLGSGKPHAELGGVGQVGADIEPLNKMIHFLNHLPNRTASEASSSKATIL